MFQVSGRYAREPQSYLSHGADLGGVSTFSHPQPTWDARSTWVLKSDIPLGSGLHAVSSEDRSHWGIQASERMLLRDYVARLADLNLKAVKYSGPSGGESSAAPRSALASKNNIQRKSRRMRKATRTRGLTFGTTTASVLSYSSDASSLFVMLCWCPDDYIFPCCRRHAV